MQILSFLYFSSLISKENQILNEEDNLHKIFVILEEEINHVDIVDIWNLEDFLRHVFINEECLGILKQSYDGWERTRNINEKKKPGIL